MKYLERIILVLSLIVFGNVAMAQKMVLASVTITFAGFDIETVRNINCDEFDHLFQDSKKTKIFRSKSILSTFSNFKKQFKELTFPESVDTRGTIIFRYGLKEEKYCFTELGTFILYGKCYKNKKLLAFISDQLYHYHPKHLDEN